MRRAGLVLLTAGVLSGCGSSPAGPTPPPPVDALTLSCPADITRPDVVGPSAIIDYPAPQATGGAPPLSVQCSPASGSTFPLGPTSVSCSVTDTAARNAVCGFTVLLTPVPVIGATRFLAFGDSLTAGEVSFNPSILAVDPTVAYPTVLRERLSARYQGQTIMVDNRGLPGESAEKGQDRLPTEIDRTQPEVLLLLQGVIDFSEQGSAAIPIVIEALRADIQKARARGVAHIFLSTLLPEKPGEKSQAMPYLIEANDEIRALAASEGVNLVDGYAAIVGHEATLVGKDGLHLTPMGYEVLATTFFDAVVKVLDKSGAPTLSPLRRRR